METKIQKVFVDEGFGFPVYMLNVPMIKVRGQWTPNIDYNRHLFNVLMALTQKPARLNGAEIRFIRQSLELTLQKFGERFGVSHAAVIKWEKRKNETTNMAWSTEKDIRLAVIESVSGSPEDLAKLYADLKTVMPNKAVKIQVSAKKAA